MYQFLRIFDLVLGLPDYFLGARYTFRTLLEPLEVFLYKHRRQFGRLGPMHSHNRATLAPKRRSGQGKSTSEASNDKKNRFNGLKKRALGDSQEQAMGRKQ